MGEQFARMELLPSCRAPRQPYLVVAGQSDLVVVPGFELMRRQGRGRVWTRRSPTPMCQNVRAMAESMIPKSLTERNSQSMRMGISWRPAEGVSGCIRWARLPPTAVRSSMGQEAAAGGEQAIRFRNWVKEKIEQKQREQVPPGEKVMRMVATATSAPVAQYIAEPVTALHTLDPRVKQAWLLALVIVPARAHVSIRLGLVVFLVLATVCSLPRRIWQDQLRRMVFLSGLLFVFTALGTDGVPPVVHTRTPPASLDGLSELLPSLNAYSYVLFKIGPLQLTRKGLALAITTSTLSFTVLQSATLCLTTTTPEELAAGLRWFLAPLMRFGAPVDEIILTLLLSLRFVSLVFDEVRNIALAVVARAVQWKGLKLVETIDVLCTLVGRLFKNLLHHSEKISEAMVVRGYRGDPAKHRLYFLTQMSLKWMDKLAVLALVALVVVTTYVEMVVPI